MSEITPIVSIATLNLGYISEVLRRSQTDFTPISSRETFDLAALCTHANINMWAKYKPFRSNTMFFQQDGDSTKSDRDEEMRRQNHGIQPPGTRTSTDIVSCINDVWTYLRPRGKDYNEPFRLADFINYSHCDNAFAVAKASIAVNRYFDYSGIITLTQQEGIASIYALHASDFSAFDTLSNLAVLVTPASGGSVFVRVTQGIQERVQVTTREINALPFAFGERLTFAFLATNHAPTSFTDAPGNSQWLIMPNDGVNKTHGELIFTSDFHHNKTCNGFALDATAQPFTNYTGRMPSGGGATYYFHPTAAGRYSGYLDLTLTNTAEAVTLKRNLFSVRAYNNLMTGNNDTPLMEIPKMYVGGVETEEVDVAQGASVTIRFMLPDNIFVTTTSGGTGSVVVSRRLMSCVIKFYYNNITDSIVFSQEIRIKDYE